MKAFNLKSITITELHDIIGGMSSASKDFIVCKNVAWDRTALGEPYKAAASAVVLCVKGWMRMKVNMRSFRMERGCLQMYGRDSVMEVMERSDDCRLNIIFFTNTFIQDTILDLKTVLPIFKYISQNEEDLLQLDEEELALVEKFYELIHDSLTFNSAMIIRDLMAAFVRILGELYGKRVTGQIKMRTRQEEYLERFIEQVQLHYRKERSVQFYANRLHITPKYLSTVIKEVSGRSAADIINGFVVQEAKMMLKFSGKSIQEITYELNFSTQSFFGKYFKRHTGMSPSEYRAQQQ